MEILVYLEILFQSTLPNGERLVEVAGFFFECKFQSTLPNGERRNPIKIIRFLACISIHAPERGATFRSTLIDPYCDISIHAPERGATALFTTFSISAPFQSTLPNGERLRSRSRPAILKGISIHAPERGATCDVSGGSVVNANFNPRSRTGSD